ADRAALARRAREAEIEASRIPDLVHAVRDWRGAPLSIVRRVELDLDRVVVALDLASFLSGVGEMLRHAIPMRIRRRGVEMRIVIDGERTVAPRSPDAALLKAVVRAREWFEELRDGRARTYQEIAEREGVTQRYVGHMLPLAFLSPEIVAA